MPYFTYFAYRVRDILYIQLSKSYTSPAIHSDVKEQILPRDGRGMGRDTNPVAHGSVIARGKGKR